MNHHTKTDHVARENILRLLSDDEVARVSRIEATARLLDGEESLDREELEQGVRSAFGTPPTPMGHVLARRAVHAATWDKILERLAMLHVARAQTGG
jgi:hypothetical protein